MTLLQIRYFKAVVRTGNITNAADELYVSRPAISRAMRDLEREFGIALFWRSNMWLALTEAGCAFYEACNDIQNRIDSLEAQLAQMKAQNRRQDIRPGLTPLTGAAVFPRLYQAFREACPNAHIVTMEHSHDQARLVFCVSASHPLAGWSCVSIYDIHGLPVRGDAAGKGNAQALPADRAHPQCGAAHGAD